MLELKSSLSMNCNPGCSAMLTSTVFSRKSLRIVQPPPHNTYLLDQGVRTGDRIGMVSENRAEMYMFEMAAMSIGAVTVPIFAGYPAQQVAYVLDSSRPRYVVVSGKHQLDKIERDEDKRTDD